MSEATAAPFYEFDCGHTSDTFVQTTRIRRACPVCRSGKAVAFHKPCEICGADMPLELSSNRTRFCPKCRSTHGQGCARVAMRRSSKHHTPASEDMKSSAGRCVDGSARHRGGT